MKRGKPPDSFVRTFRREKGTVLKMLGQLNRGLNLLQFEGKLLTGRNTKRLELALHFLKSKFESHIQMDDHIIFPYLEKHIPKLDVSLRFLKAERNEFIEQVKEFETILQKFEMTSGPRRLPLLRELVDRGIYLVCLIRNHIQMEEESVYMAIDEELHPDEKNELLKRIKKFTPEALS